MKGSAEPSRIGISMLSISMNALLHQAGGIADARDVLTVRFDGKVVQVHAAEDYAGIRRCRKEAEMRMNTRMETNALCINRTVDGALEHKCRFKQRSTLEAKQNKTCLFLS